MVPEQAPVLLRFLFNRTRATNAQPRPMLRWFGEEQQTIRDELNADGGIQLEGLVNNEVTNSIEDLTVLWRAAVQGNQHRFFGGTHIYSGNIGEGGIPGLIHNYRWGGDTPLCF